MVKPYTVNVSDAGSIPVPQPKKRALRRHHRTRMYKHAKHILYNVWHEYIWQKDLTNKEVHARIAFRTDTFTNCSCEMCRNERRSKWNSNKYKITMQERKNNEKFDTDIKEYT